MSVSKGLKRLIKQYVKVYGIQKGKRRAYKEWNRRKKARRNKYLNHNKNIGFWWDRK